MTSTNILDILSEHGGSMERSQLRTCLRGFSIGRINMKLEDLAKEGWIKLSGNTVILIAVLKAHQMLQRGNVNEDYSIEQIGHNQVSVPYDNTLFRVVNESNEFLDTITVDEDMVNLLNAIWRHGIPTFHSCQGGEGDKAWIRFLWRKSASRFLDLVPQSCNANTWEQCFNEDEKNFQISFPPEDIVRITEELNSKPID